MYNQIKDAVKFLLPKSVYGPMAEGFRPIWALRYAGNKVQCAVCKRRSSRFLPWHMRYEINEHYTVVAGRPRKNHHCPACHATSRMQMMYFYLEQLFQSKSERFRVLHVAPERSLRKWLSEHDRVDYVSMDIGSPMAMVHTDLMQLCFDENQFDVVIASHVLEHVYADRQAMRELLRILKPEAVAILQVPIALELEQTIDDPDEKNPLERERRFGQNDHLRLYGQDYADRLAEEGFAVEEYDMQAELGQALVDLHCLEEGETLFLCRKPPQ